MELNLEKIIKKGENILLQDDDVNGIYFIDSGTIKVSKPDNLDSYTYLGLIGKNDTIPETFGKSQNTYIAATDVKYTFIGEYQLDELQNSQSLEIMKTALKSSTQWSKYLESKCYNANVPVVERIEYELNRMLEKELTLDSLKNLCEIMNIRDETFSRNIKKIENREKYANLFTKKAAKNTFLKK